MMADVFLYVCSYVCVCVVLFDILFAVYVYRSERMLPKLVGQMRALLVCGMENESYILRERLQSKLKKLLTHELWVKAFMICNTAFLTEEPAQWRRYVRANLGVFVALAQDYGRQAPEYQTLFARMITELPLYACAAEDRAGVKRAFSELARVFERQATADSAFLRQNALRAIISLGDANAVVHSFIGMNRRPALINGKLLSDDLLAFPGDACALTKLLWACFPEFTPTLKTCTIDYFRLLPERVDQRPYLEGVRQIMMDAEADAETRFAAIRYFRRHRYPKARKSLMELLKSGGGHENYAAIAASSLQSYPGEQTEKLLLKHLGDPDWYVRFNAAESLIHLGVDYESIVLNSDDRYAREMLIYRAEVNRLRGGNGGAA